MDRGAPPAARSREGELYIEGRRVGARRGGRRKVVSFETPDDLVSPAERPSCQFPDHRTMSPIPQSNGRRRNRRCWRLPDTSSTGQQEDARVGETRWLRTKGSTRYAKRHRFRWGCASVISSPGLLLPGELLNEKKGMITHQLVHLSVLYLELSKRALHHPSMQVYAILLGHAVSTAPW
jgi:hypothetical protein